MIIMVGWIKKSQSRIFLTKTTVSTLLFWFHSYLNSISKPPAKSFDSLSTHVPAPAPCAYTLPPSLRSRSKYNLATARRTNYPSLRQLALGWGCPCDFCAATLPDACFYEMPITPGFSHFYEIVNRSADVLGLFW